MAMTLVILANSAIGDGMIGDTVEYKAMPAVSDLPPLYFLLPG